MDDNSKNSESSKNNTYDALRSMFMHPPVYLPPGLGQSMDGSGLLPGMIPGQGAASNMLFGHPFVPGSLPMLPYRDFAYLPFPAAAAALESTSRSGQSPSDGAAAASAANFWTGLYPFVADPFLAEAMKMNLTPYLAAAEAHKENSKKSVTGKEGKKSSTSSSPKTDVKQDLKRKMERSSSSHSESSTSSYDRQTPGSKSPAASVSRVSSSPIRKEHTVAAPPPLIKTPPAAHERKRPKLDSPSTESALDFSSKPSSKLMDAKKSLLPNRDNNHDRVRSRGAPNFGDVEWLSNPDSSPKKSPSDRVKVEAAFLNDPVLRGEALQVRIAQYNVSQLRSRLELDRGDTSWTARIEPEFSDLGYKDSRERSTKPRSDDGHSAFERVDKLPFGRDSVIVSRSEPKSFSERMSDIARRHAAATEMKDPGFDLRGYNPERHRDSSLDLRGITTYPSRQMDYGIDLKSSSGKRKSISEPSNEQVKRQCTSSRDTNLCDKLRDVARSMEAKDRPKPKQEPSKEPITLKDSVDNILDSILNTYAADEEETTPVNQGAIHSHQDCDDKDAKDNDEPEAKNVDQKDNENEKESKDTSDSKEAVVTNDNKEPKAFEQDAFSGGEMHGLSSSFLPLSEVLSTAISSEFARHQPEASTPEPDPNIPAVSSATMTRLFSQSSMASQPSLGEYSGQTNDDNPYDSIANIIDRLEKDDDDDEKEESATFQSRSGDLLASLADKIPPSIPPPCSTTIPKGSNNTDFSSNTKSTEDLGTVLPTPAIQGYPTPQQNANNGLALPESKPSHNANIHVDKSKYTDKTTVENDTSSTLTDEGQKSTGSNGESEDPDLTADGQDTEPSNGINVQSEATKLVLVKDPRNGYAVKSHARDSNATTPENPINPLDKNISILAKDVKLNGNSGSAENGFSQGDNVTNQSKS